MDLIDREPRGMSLAEKVTNFYAYCLVYVPSDQRKWTPAGQTLVDVVRGE